MAANAIASILKTALNKSRFNLLLSQTKQNHRLRGGPSFNVLPTGELFLLS